MHWAQLPAPVWREFDETAWNGGPGGHASFRLRKCADGSFCEGLCGSHVYEIIRIQESVLLSGRCVLENKKLGDVFQRSEDDFCRRRLSSVHDRSVERRQPEDWMVHRMEQPSTPESLGWKDLLRIRSAGLSVGNRPIGACFSEVPREFGCPSILLQFKSRISKAAAAYSMKTLPAIVRGFDHRPLSRAAAGTWMRVMVAAMPTRPEWPLNLSSGPAAFAERAIG